MIIKTEIASVLLLGGVIKALDDTGYHAVNNNTPVS